MPRVVSVTTSGGAPAITAAIRSDAGVASAIAAAIRWDALQQDNALTACHAVAWKVCDALLHANPRIYATIASQS